MSCPEYIDCIVVSHDWQDEPDIGTPGDLPISPIPEGSITKMYGEFLGTSTRGPKEGTLEHLKLQKSMGFSYQTLLGEMLFAYVTYRPDIAIHSHHTLKVLHLPHHAPLWLPQRCPQVYLSY